MSIWRGDGTNRVAACLLTLYDHVVSHYPGRATGNDGTLGDIAHQARHSDHNPDERGIVRALDITHDPAHGFNSYLFADFLREHWDDRVQYLISNSRIANADAIDGAAPKAWRAYHGEDPHNHHIHVSARGDARADDARPWDIAAFLGGSVGKPPAPPIAVGPFVPLDQRTIDAITIAAAGSDLAFYSWNDRGRAPAGYIKGMAVTFGMALRKLAARDSAALAMVRVVDGQEDVFDHYDLWTRDAPDIDRLRALWVVLTGLGMRESSGNYSEGRDTSASNTSADTAEAGLFQMSWNAHTTNPEIPKLFDAYGGGKYPGFLEIFKEGVAAKNTDTFGDGDGAAFQRLAKIKPAFAVEAAAIGLRTLCTHWGPIIRHEAEIVPAADALFRQVQTIVQPIDGEVLPPKFDNQLIIALLLVLFEGTDMDKNLNAAMLAELQKPNPDFRALLLQALNATGTPGLPPPSPPPPPPPPSITRHIYHSCRARWCNSSSEASPS